jgi:hypothetical protein
MSPKLVRGPQQAASLALGTELNFAWPLTLVFVERGLGIKEIPLEWPAIHKQLDDSASAWPMMTTSTLLRSQCNVIR